MKRTTKDNLLKVIAHIPAWLEDAEKLELFDLGSACIVGDRIVEVGTLYGGSSACLGLGARDGAELLIFDNFSWTPDGFPTATAALAAANLTSVGLKNFNIIEMDSLNCEYSADDKPISLLWVDGGHSLEFITHDLETFGPFAQVIACHDYGNTFWTTIKAAVEKFIEKHPEFYLDHVTGMIAVLRRK